MIQPEVWFILGILTGQASVIIALVLGKVTIGLTIKRLEKTEKKEVMTCPKCESKKYTFTETPGVLWCLSCGAEYGNGTAKPKHTPKVKKNITPKRVRFNFDDDGLGMGETGRKPGINKPS